VNRIRSVKPEIRRNRKLSDCGLVAHFLAHELITLGDDQGRFRATARDIKGEVFAYYDDIKLPTIEKAILALDDVGFIELYESDGDRFGWMPKWFKHQRLQTDRYTWSELPPPPSFEPEIMSPAILNLWQKAAERGELPAGGDGLLLGRNGTRLVPNRVQGGSTPDTTRLQSVSNLEPDRAGLEPRARTLSGTEGRGVQEKPPYPPTVATEPESVLAPAVEERAARLRAAVEAADGGIWGQPLTAIERPVVVRWAGLQRDGDYVPVEEIVECARRRMQGGTPDGTPPGSLNWADRPVMGLARRPLDIGDRRPSDAAAAPKSRSGRVRHVVSPEDEATMNAWMARGLAETQGTQPQ
jgi:hypothetical protein